MTPKELQHIAPKLYELQKLKSGFDIPKEYFEAIEDGVISSLHIKSIDKQNLFETPDNYFDLVEISVLEKIKDQNASIPKDYFNTIEDNVFEKINSEIKSNPVKIVRFNKRLLIGVAASILLLFSLQFFNFKDNNQFASLDLLDIEYWIESGEFEFDSHDIDLAYEDINIDGLDIYNYYEDDDILEYLDGIDVESFNLTE